MHFADRLHERVTRLNSHLVIGVDPDPRRLFGHDSLLLKAFPRRDMSYILEKFCFMALEAAAETACAVKPQAAFFESMGIPGLEVLKRLVDGARSRGIPVIFDAKRGDIGNTAHAYAEAYLGPNAWLRVDALTVNPYLGPDTLEPFIQAANSSETGLFVLVKTSNPGSGAFQDALMSDGRTLYSKVAEAVDEAGAHNVGECGYSNIGAVCGATYPQELGILRKLMPRTVFLVPGYGAQGGTAGDVVEAFNPGGTGAIVSASRSIIFAYQKKDAEPDPEVMSLAVLSAAKAAKEDIEKAAALKSRLNTST
ncbi:MAG TPA: orotidine-5'-phosphate decarboxylase [Firmicutes bacterium]|nr:orotidine-5'-phosphate decarboxylase [Candidatus Fermentithermobacillaceae bacterium]